MVRSVIVVVSSDSGSDTGPPSMVSAEPEPSFFPPVPLGHLVFSNGVLLSGGTRLALAAELLYDDDADDASDEEAQSSISTSVGSDPPALMSFPLPLVDVSYHRLDDFRLAARPHEAELDGEADDSDDDWTEVWVLGQDGVIVKLDADGQWRDARGRLARGPR